MTKGDGMTTVEMLKAARKTIEDPNHWLRHALVARDGGRAVRWCAAGALREVAGDYAAATPAMLTLERAMGERIGHFNDQHSHAEVLAKFDEAITIAVADA